MAMRSALTRDEETHRKNFGKHKTSLDVEKINNSVILKPTCKRLCERGLLFQFPFEQNLLWFCDFLHGFAVSNRPLLPPSKKMHSLLSKFS